MKKLGPERYLVWDLLRETDPYYLNHHLIDIDFTAVEACRTEWRAAGTPPPTYLAFALAAYARGLARFPELNSYLRVWPMMRLATYHGVDVALTVEREWLNRSIILLAILRDAQALSLKEISHFLNHRKTAPLEDLEEFASYRSLLKLPAFCRWHLFQIFCKPFPQLMRRLVGTTAFTSIGKFGSSFTVSLSPRSCTLSFGKVEHRPRSQAGNVVSCLSAWITLAYDHRIVDGAYVAQMGKFIKDHLEHIHETP
jgi:pyruvate/2-oxoglutarate dehydrogenase complex dihydrolipoamide acyltransferase (E2) component